MRNREKPFRFKWADAVRNSDLPATTKHVLLALSTYMKNTGTDCWPSYQRIAKDTSRNRTTVIKHIQNAVNLGWIVKKVRHDVHGDHTSNVYLPRIPNSSLTKQLPGCKQQQPWSKLNGTVVAAADSNNTINHITNKTNTVINVEESRKQVRELVGLK